MAQRSAAFPPDVLRKLVKATELNKERTFTPFTDASDSDLEARVLGSPVARDEALRWACRSGCVAGIEAAIRVGASVSAVPVAANKASRPVALIHAGLEKTSADHALIKALTLQLAAKAGQVQAFEYLLKRGARLDAPGASLASVRSLVTLVTCGPDAPSLLRLLLKSQEDGIPVRLVSQLSQNLRDEALLNLLLSCSGPWPSDPQYPTVEEYTGFLQVLIDAGASTNAFRRHGRLRWDASQVCNISALSVAVATGSSKIVELLLDHGAVPNGPPELQPPPVSRWPLHIPLCAACYLLAIPRPVDTHPQEVRTRIRLLLDRGADINVAVPLLQPDLCFITFTNPLLVFLDTVDDWDATALSSLRFLLDRGASPVGSPIPLSGPSHGERHSVRYPELLRGGRFRFGKSINIIEVLLDRWSVQSLGSNPVFAEAIELLVSHTAFNQVDEGAARVAETLARYDHVSNGGKHDEAIVTAWTANIKSTTTNLSETALNDFLHAYVTRKVTCPEQQRWPRSGYHRSSDHPIADLARSTVQVLLLAGADISHRRNLTNLGTEKEGMTVLHAVSLWLAGRDPAEESSALGWSPDCRGARHTPQRTEFVRYLVHECGARTDFRYEGRTAAEILQQLSRHELDEDGDCRQRTLDVLMGEAAV